MSWAARSEGHRAWPPAGSCPHTSAAPHAHKNASAKNLALSNSSVKEPNTDFFNRIGRLLPMAVPVSRHSDQRLLSSAATDRRRPKAADQSIKSAVQLRLCYLIGSSA